MTSDSAWSACRLCPLPCRRKRVKLRIEIRCDNAAFQDAGPGHEVARILRQLADKCETEGDVGPDSVIDGYWLYDLNGNNVGKVTVEAGA